MSALPPTLDQAAVPGPVLQVVSRLAERGFKAYLVGGCVRDLVRGVAPKDFDLATSARPEEVGRAFPRVIPTGIKHGTVTVLSGGQRIEVTTFRTEGPYLDGRRPSSVEFRGDIREDLSRRDFTINAMAFDPLARELVDPFGGQADLLAAVVRCVGDPQARFAEDGLRPLRAVRFAAVLGFRLDPATEAAIPHGLPVFQKVAMERVREELARLLLSERPGQGLQLLHRSGLLTACLPELGSAPPEELPRLFAAAQAAPPELEIRLAALLQGLGPERAWETLQRLKLPNRVIELVMLLIGPHRPEELTSAPDASLRRFASLVGEANLRPLLELAKANRAARGQEAEQLRQLEERFRRLLSARPPLSPRQLALDGRAIMNLLAVPPSAIVGEATRFLLEQVLENPDLNSPDRLGELLRNWASTKGR